MSDNANNGDVPPNQMSVTTEDEGPGFEVLLGDVPLELTVELGRVTMSLREIGAKLTPGSTISLAKLTGEKLDIRINDRLVARGEAVAVGDRYGVRIVEILTLQGGKQS